MKKQSFFSAMSLPLISVLAALVIMGACKEPAAHGISVDPLGSGYGRIAVNLTAGQQSARTVLPAMVFDRYVYTFIKAGETVGAEQAPDNNGYFTLEVGIYSVTVQAFIGSAEPYTLAASGVSASFNVDSGDNAPVVVFLTEVSTEGIGEFSYIITYPENAWGEISMLKYPNMVAVGLAPTHVCDSNGLSETVELEAGIYLLTVQVSLNGRYAGITESVYIYPSLTTIYDKDFVDEDFHGDPPVEPPTEPTITGNVKFEYYWVDQHESLITTSEGAVSIAANETLAIAAQGTGYTVRNWYLNGVNTNESGNTFYFTGTSAGNYTIGIFAEKDGKLYNTNITITVEAPPSTPPASNTRTVKIDMYDQYGDGWGGNGAIRININGIDIVNVKVGNLNTLNNPTGQRSVNTYTFSVKTGDIVELFWVSGSNQGENSFIVYYTDAPPLPAFTSENNNHWIGENALIYILRNSMNYLPGGSLLGSFTVA